MRQILYRGKRVDNGEWVYGWYTPLVCNDKTEIPSIKDFNGSDWRVEPKTIGQYTGLPDKNRKKIFESDIVRITTGIKGYESTYHSAIQKVRYETDECGIALFYPFDNSDMVEVEVIGNIYDNPELLGVEE